MKSGGTTKDKPVKSYGVHERRTEGEGDDEKER